MKVLTENVRQVRTQRNAMLNTLTVREALKEEVTVVVFLFPLFALWGPFTLLHPENHRDTYSFLLITNLSLTFF